MMQITEFRIGSSWFAVDVLDIQEVSYAMTSVSVPKTPLFIKGLLNLRGKVCTVVDLRKLFGLTSETERSMNIISDSQQGMIAYEVDEIGDVFEIDSSHLKDVPETIHEEVRRYVTSVFYNEGKYISIVDTKLIAQKVLNND